MISDVLMALLLAGAVNVAEDRGAWFKSLMRPDTGTSCCDAADCKPTRAENRDGQWFAEVEGIMRPVPPKSVLAFPVSYDGRAYVCVSGGKVLCFIRPGAGS